MINNSVPITTVRVGRQPIYPKFVAFPTVCFTGALLTDIAYAVTADIMWADFSDWLLLIGVVFCGLAAIIGFVELLRYRRMPALRPSGRHMIGNLIVLVLAIFDNLFHSRDAWTSVMPVGLILSAAIVVIMFIIGWSGGPLAYRQPVSMESLEVRP